MAWLGRSETLPRLRDSSPIEQQQGTLVDSGVVVPTSPIVHLSHPPAGAISPPDTSVRGGAFPLTQRRPGVRSSQSNQSRRSRQVEPISDAEAFMTPDVQVARTTTTGQGIASADFRSTNSHGVPETPNPFRAPPGGPATFARGLIENLRCSRSPSVEAPSLPDISNVHDIATLEIDPDEFFRLRESRNALVNELNESTTLVNRLRNFKSIEAADAVVREARLETMRYGKGAAEERAAEERILRKIWMGLCLMIVVGLSVYAYLCWWNGAEMEYVRMRRKERFGL